MRIKAPTEVVIDLTNEHVKHIACEYFCQKRKWRSDYFIDEKGCVCYIEGREPRESLITVRKATLKDRETSIWFKKLF